MSNAKCFINAKITTMDETVNEAECLIVQDGKVIYVGSTKEGQRLVNDEDEMINLNGRRVIPGFIDAHMHIRNYCKRHYGVNLAGLNSIKKYREIISD